MSKAMRAMKGKAGVAAKPIIHGVLKTYVPAGQASGSPPLGTMLGQRGINIPNFVKDFNEKTKLYRPGVPLILKVFVNPDRSYQLSIQKPQFPFYLMQAAGITRGAMMPGREISGKITHKHLYEIAKLKNEDIQYQAHTLQQVVDVGMYYCRQIGIQVVREINPEEYGQFLEERQKIAEQQRQELDEKREAKMLRTG